MINALFIHILHEILDLPGNHWSLNILHEMVYIQSKPLNIIYDPWFILFILYTY